jgi:hypothetical protein
LRKRRWARMHQQQEKRYQQEYFRGPRIHAV